MFRIGLIFAAVICVFAAPALAAPAAPPADPALSAAANAAFLKANAARPGVVVRPSGIQYRIIRSGFGAHPGPFDTVSVEYKGSLINGKVFDGTEAGMPAQLEVDKLIAGWREALTIMRVGDNWQVVVPASLAYGGRGAGAGRIGPDQTLVFDLQLEDTKPPPPKEKPDDDDSH